jgi:hypothetical protein
MVRALQLEPRSYNGYSPAPTWSGLRRVTAFIPWLVVLTTVVVGPWLAPQSVVWLEQSARRPTSNVATVVLLFDEMNVGATQGMQELLTRRGLHVSFKPVRPVHGSTTEVIAALISGEDFKGAGAYGMSTVCAENTALAFDQILVLRSSTLPPCFRPS